MNSDASLPDLLSSLRSTLRGGDEPSIDELEDLLREIHDLGDPACIAPLLLMLRDDTEPFHFVWSVIHTAEAFPESDYLDQLLIALPELNARAPELVENLHTRILNDDACRARYAERLQAAGEESREAARDVLFRIRADDPQFEEKVGWLLREM